ncbi:MAG: 5-oxoprolinase subunit PxpB [Burkholderiales bacterium]|nr:5-oxoprolinase subunit PxpB [Burkholderiales bacterium]
MAVTRKDFSIFPLGDSAVLAEFGTRLDLDVNLRLQRLAEAVRAKRVPWIRDIVPALGSLALHFDPGSVPAGLDPVEAAERLLKDSLRGALRAPRGRSASLEVPVCYDPELAPDLAEVAERVKLSVGEVVRRHAVAGHRVLMMGFAPGQPYIGGLDATLVVPRRATPRMRVPAGSIAIANAQTAVYPFEISGGWNVIGRTPLRVFDVEREPAALFTPGMNVRFVVIDRAEYERRCRL